MNFSADQADLQIQISNQELDQEFYSWWVKGPD